MHDWWAILDTSIPIPDLSDAEQQETDSSNEHEAGPFFDPADFPSPLDSKEYYAAVRKGYISVIDTNDDESSTDDDIASDDGASMDDNAYYWYYNYYGPYGPYGPYSFYQYYYGYHFLPPVAPVSAADIEQQQQQPSIPHPDAHRADTVTATVVKDEEEELRPYSIFYPDDAFLSHFYDHYYYYNNDNDDVGPYSYSYFMDDDQLHPYYYNDVGTTGPTDAADIPANDLAM